MYCHPEPAEPLTQGDVIDGCPILFWDRSRRRQNSAWEPVDSIIRGVVLTQSCDLAQGKSTRVVVAVVHAAQALVDEGMLGESLIRDQIRRHRVYGWYFLPAGGNLPESLVDLRDLHTLPRAIPEQLAREGKRVCRVETPYREHMAQHFSVTYSRIGLPQPYGTQD